MTLKGQIVHSVSKHACHSVVIYLLFSFAFSLLLVDKCLPDVTSTITALTFLAEASQLAIKQPLGVRKQMRCIAQFLYYSMALVNFFG